MITVCANAQSQLQEFPQTIQIPTKQQPNRATKTEEHTKENKNSATNPPITIFPSPPFNQREKANYQRKESGEDTEQGSEYFPAFFGIRFKITDLLLSIFTFLLFVYTARLYYATRGVWIATEKLVTGAEDVAKRQLRAYLSGEVIKISSPIEDIVSAKIKIVNHGQTPAYNVRVCGCVEIFPYPLYPNYPMPTFLNTLDNSEIVVHVKHEFVTQVVNVRELTSHERGEIVCANRMPTNARFYVLGIIRYKDTFNIERHTKFCISAIQINAKEIHCETATQHNEAT